MKKSKRKRYKDMDTIDSGMSFGEGMHELGKRTTEKVYSSKKEYKRKPKYKQNWLDYE